MKPPEVKANLVALSSAAIITVYAVGFERTQAAAQRFASDADDRQPPAPGPSTRAQPPRAIAPAPAPTAEPVHAPETPAKPTTKPAAPAPRVDSVAPARAPAAASTPAPTVPVPPEPVAPTAPAATTPAPAPAPAPRDTATKPAVATDTAANALKDGTFTGWGTSRHGDIQATVMVKNGKIFFAAISECLTQYSCSWIAALPPQVVERQSAEVDYVSGATQSTRAFYYAVIEALKKAK